MLALKPIFEIIPVPWRSKKNIKFSIGDIEYHGLNYKCLVLDELDYVIRLTPSFMFLLKSFDLIKEKNQTTNGQIVFPSHAQTTYSHKILKTGSCTVTTYFMGMPKNDRDFDFIFRLFEHGFKLSDFKGFEDFNELPLNNESRLDISSHEYSHPSIITGQFKLPKINGRITRVS